ncbi:lipoprotein [Nibricoccus sp. IMCC34717]|uniref:LptM family lipoprotein n=1 Tax=Nibricoccus sp. IMCC34717 TaxID=3034021 RepID=UPI0038510A1A
MRVFRFLVSLVALVFILAGCGKKPAPQPVFTPNPLPLPADFAAAFDAFRPEGTRGWSFTQLTTSKDAVVRERHDAALPEFKRWTLLEKEGRAPTAEETKEYTDLIARRPRSDNAPNVRDQVIRESWVELPATPEGFRPYQFRIRPGGEDDSTAAFMAVVFTFDPRTRAIAEVALRSQEPFKPAFGVRIQEATTRVRYLLPEGDRPVLMRDIEVRVRGKAFGFKSLDRDMTVVYSDYEKPAAK